MMPMIMDTAVKYYGFKMMKVIGLATIIRLKIMSESLERTEEQNPKIKR